MTFSLTPQQKNAFHQAVSELTDILQSKQVPLANAKQVATSIVSACGLVLDIDTSWINKIKVQDPSVLISSDNVSKIINIKDLISDSDVGKLAVWLSNQAFKLQPSAAGKGELVSVLFAKNGMLKNAQQSGDTFEDSEDTELKGDGGNITPETDRQSGKRSEFSPLVEQLAASFGYSNNERKKARFGKTDGRIIFTFEEHINDNLNADQIESILRLTLEESRSMFSTKDIDTLISQTLKNRKYSFKQFCHHFALLNFKYYQAQMKFTKMRLLSKNGDTLVVRNVTEFKQAIDDGLIRITLEHKDVKDGQGRFNTQVTLVSEKKRNANAKRK